MGYYQRHELLALGFRHIGQQVLIDRSTQVYNPENISIGDNVRIDGFSILSAGKEITIGSHIHIGAGCYVFGSSGCIQFCDFSGLSPGVKIFSASDDFIEGWLRGPIIDQEFRKVKCGDVTLRENAVVASGSVISPGITLGRNSSVCALTVVTKDVEDNAIVSGNPARQIGWRDAAKSDQLMASFKALWQERSQPLDGNHG